MGTPAFPNLGKHCSVDDCKLIDFLPFTCDCCFKVYCLEHRSYATHKCPKGNKHDVSVVICPLCAKSVRLIPDEDPNITWESHVNTECDPSNFEKVTKKRKCPVPRCKELLTFSNTVRCRDCTLDHCLKHRFGLDHNCPGPKKPESAFPFMSNFLSGSRKETTSRPSQVPPSTSSSRWATSFLNAASSFRATAEAGIAKFSNEFNQKGQTQTEQSGGNQKIEQCPHCSVRFSSVAALIDHVEKVHEKNGNRPSVMRVTLDVCPKCSKGFRDAVSLVEHVERDHGGKSKG
ncbi:zinc finger AN1 and C2H2 domain-containing stress-associated protein 11-like [Impatiens glandulifera]|uniref:zinc finger AN1 and C2H2 domain-containing stress-associated protein 11-like n=1 Tax=Impatiens glandulifera TaxID=253017 RepID=UPI001FB0B17E|nr:zinc finger AN1 and C2H2 domain-containing stress-associated protein 11-like [Impatiens glandulifera]